MFIKRETHEPFLNHLHMVTKPYSLGSLFEQFQIPRMCIVQECENILFGMMNSIHFCNVDQVFKFIREIVPIWFFEISDESNLIRGKRAHAFFPKVFK